MKDETRDEVLKREAAACAMAAWFNSTEHLRESIVAARFMLCSEAFRPRPKYLSILRMYGLVGTARYKRSGFSVTWWGERIIHEHRKLLDRTEPSANWGKYGKMVAKRMLVE